LGGGPNYDFLLAFVVTEFRIGVTEVGSFTGPWTLFFDDVLVEQK
jgi:hypothetical protein